MIKKYFIVLFLLAIIILSCKEQKKDVELKPQLSGGFGKISLKITFQYSKISALKTKSIDNSSITHADIQVEGIGINTISLNNQNLTNPINLSIPTGKNRIITVIGKNETQIVAGAEIKGIVSVTFGSSGSVNIDWSTTPTANVIKHLINDANGTQLDGIYEFYVDKLNAGDLNNYINNLVPASHPSLVDSQKIADYIKNNNGNLPPGSEAANYLITPAVLTGTINGILSGDFFTITVSDPASSPIIITPNTPGYPNFTIGRITPTNIFTNNLPWNASIKWNNKPLDWTADYNIDPVSINTGAITSGQQLNNINFNVYWPTPALTGFSPSNSLLVQGERLTLNGINFHANPNANILIFGDGATVNAVSVTNSTTLQLNIPSNTTNPVIKVKIGDKTSNSITAKIASQVITFAGSGTAGNVNGSNLSAQFNTPRKIVFNSAGDTMYVADSNNQVVRMINSGTVTTVPIGWNWPPTAYGLAIDTNNRLYITSTNYHNVQRYDGSGTAINVSGWPGSASFNTWEAYSYSYSCCCCWGYAYHNQPQGIVVKKDGSRALIGDTYNHIIRKTDVNSRNGPSSCWCCCCSGYDNMYYMRTVAGSTGAGFVDGTGTSAQFNKPIGVAFNSNEDVLYVADSGNNAIRKVTNITNDASNVGEVTTIAGTGVAGYADGAGNAAKFNNPTDVAVDSSGNMWVADMDNHRIRKIVKTGTANPDVSANYTVYTVAGTGANGFNDNCLPKDAKFNQPGYLTIDNNGYIYVADAGNYRIRKIQ